MGNCTITNVPIALAPAAAFERCHADACGKEKFQGELFHSLFLVQFGREMESGCPEQCQRGCVEGETLGRPPIQISVFFLAQTQAVEEKDSFRRDR